MSSADTCVRLLNKSSGRESLQVFVWRWLICRQIGLRRGASRRDRAAYKDVRERASRRATKYQVDLTSKEGWRAVPPALAEVGYGCFLPDLTRFTTMQCGAARRCSLQ